MVSAAAGKTATYSLTAKAKHNGYQYRCKVTNISSYVYTNTVKLTVKLSGGAASGNFNIVYEPSKLTLAGVELADGLMGGVNESFADGKARVSFARIEQKQSYTVCTVSFKITGDTPTGGAAVKIQSVKVYDMDGNAMTGKGVSGTVTRAAALLSIETVRATEKQSVSEE